MPDEELEEVNQELEKADSSPWNYAHEKYEDGNTKPLEMQYHLKEMDHKEKVEQEVEKKGGYLDYDKSDAGHASAILSALSILGHPLVLTVWITLGYKVFRDSQGQINGEDTFWERLDQFGFELFYYLTYSAAVAYLLIGLQGQEIVLSNAGTVAQLLVEVMAFAGL